MKKDECVYISHLDLNRVMLRAIQKSGLNVWRTEGFHRHAYITFALPLSLGFSSKKETMDFRLLDDKMSLSKIPGMLNACLPNGIRVFDCKEQHHKAGEITSARYSIFLTSDDISLEELYDKTEALLSLDEINVEKKTKKGKSKTLNFKEFILSSELRRTEDALKLVLQLPCGAAASVNPNLFLGALNEFSGAATYASVCREEIFVKEGVVFD